MDIYGVSTPELFHIDDLLDLSNEELFFSASTSSNNDQFLPSETPFSYASVTSSSSTAAGFTPSFSPDFTHDLCLPSDDIAELEWLSQFVEDSFTDFPSNSLAGTFNPRTDHSSFLSKVNPRTDHSSFLSKAQNKRMRVVTTLNGTNWMTMSVAAATLSGNSKTKKEIQRQASPEAGGVRRCTHCASEKTPQWRTGPLGPKTLCNACGVRYKSGRLVPEYRPAASPTFVLTQHSNSHRKVLELRRQKELSRQQQQEQAYRNHHHHQQPDFEVKISRTLRSPQQTQTLSFLAIDTYAKLLLSILKHCPVEQGSIKFFLMSKILTVTVTFIQKDAEDKKASFSPKPYFRLLIGLALISWILALMILTAFANAFRALKPLKGPAFRSI